MRWRRAVDSLLAAFYSIAIMVVISAIVIAIATTVTGCGSFMPEDWFVEGEQRTHEAVAGKLRVYVVNDESLSETERQRLLKELKHWRLRLERYGDGAEEE